MPIFPNRQEYCLGGCGKVGMVNDRDGGLVFKCRSCFSNRDDPKPPTTFVEDVVQAYTPPEDPQLERLRAEAERTGDYTRVAAYKRDKAVRDNVQAIIGGPPMTHRTAPTFNVPAAKITETKEKKPMALNIKSALVRSLKQGASAGVLKVITKKLKERYRDKYPMLDMVPDDYINLAVCIMIQAASNASPDLPGMATAEAISSQAFEGLLTATVSKVVQEMVESVGEVIAEIAAENPKLLKQAKGERE